MQRTSVWWRLERSSLAATVRVGLMLAGVIPLVVGAGLVLTQANRNAAEHDRLEAGALAAKTATALSSTFAQAASQLLLVTGNQVFTDYYERPEVRPTLQPLIERQLADVSLLFPDLVDEACFIDLAGPELARSVHAQIASPSDLSPSEAGNEFFAATSALPAGQVHQHARYLSPDTGRWVVSNSTPLFVAGKAVAIVHFEISLEGTRRQLTAATEAGERIQVIDTDTGKLVLDTASGPITDVDPTDPIAPADMIRGDYPVAVAATNQNHWLVRGFVARSAAASGGALWSLTALVVATAAVLLAVAHGFTRRLGRSVDAVTGLSARLATGDLSEEIAVGRRDEIGAMAASLNTATARMADTVAIVVSEAGAVAGSSRAINALGDRVAIEADQVADRAITMGAAAQQISNEVQSMAAGTTQMHHAIDEIARRAIDAIDVAGEARAIVGDATAVVDELSGRAADITAMVALITAVAEQTNLLALNATIEAARAGAAGVGFAVVAAEVKSLSRQTKDAAAEIAVRMGTFGADSDRVRDAFSNISLIIERIHEMQTMVGAATEEQAATMRELTHSVRSAAHVTGELAVGIGEVADLSRQTRTAALASQSAARDLDNASARLHEGLAHFTTPTVGASGRLPGS